MKNHSHSHSAHTSKAVFEPANPERFAAAQKSTWVSIVINLVLTIFQVIGGFFAHSQALMADGLHSRSDLFSLGVVLYQLLARQRPFSGETVAALTYQIAHQNPACGRHSF
jgi:Co/Zn/Cd efflux system component